MKVVLLALATILVFWLWGFGFELLTDQDWWMAIENATNRTIGVVIFAWIIKDYVQEKPSKNEIGELFGKFDQSGIRMGLCEHCGKEMILAIPTSTPMETVVELVANLCKVGDLTFRHRDGDLFHFSIEI